MVDIFYKFKDYFPKAELLNLYNKFGVAFLLYADGCCISKSFPLTPFPYTTLALEMDDTHPSSEGSCFTSFSLTSVLSLLQRNWTKKIEVCIILHLRKEKLPKNHLPPTAGSEMYFLHSLTDPQQIIAAMSNHTVSTHVLESQIDLRPGRNHDQMS